MTRFNPKNNRFPYLAALFFGMAIAVTLFLDRPAPSPHKETVLPIGEDTAFNPFSDHPEYQLVLELQEAFVRNAKINRPSVVNISSAKELVEKTSWYDPHSPDSQSWFLSLKKWLSRNLREKKYVSKTLGSGLIINSQGYIITNYHVIENSEKLLVRLPDNRDHFAKVIGVDPKTDLAVLKIFSLRTLPQPEFGSSQDVKVGQWVMAIGNPYGLQGTVTVGVISGIGRADLGIAAYENFLQTDASINPGNSGGPLVNLEGKIIGLNTTVAAIGSGVGFAIPIEMALHVAEELIENGNVERGWLGVGIQEMTPDLASAFDLPALTNGVLVNSVADKAPADSGGVFRGDVIIRYNGEKVRDLRLFRHMVADTQVGQVVPIKVLREGREKNLRVKIGKLPS
jgi:S1-C subfamily serine protease